MTIFSDVFKREFQKECVRFRVIRILDDGKKPVKDEKKEQVFDTIEDAVKYYSSIKFDFVENTTVMTAIFKGCEILGKHSYMRVCKKIKELKLDL